MRIGLGILLCAVSAALLVPGNTRAEPLPFLPASGFKLAGSNGFTVYVQYGNDRVWVAAKRGRRSASYFGAAAMTPRGHRLDADLGAIADIHVTFHRTEIRRYVWDTCREDEYARGEFGYYTGTIRFRGERRYTEVEATRARSLPYRTSCRSEGVGSPGSGARLTIERDWSSFQTRFEATENRRGRPVRYFASLFEQVNGLQILRVIEARAGTGFFTYDRPLTKAVLRTPPPFSGRVVLRRRAGGQKRLRGTIRGSFPGRPDFPLTGTGQSVGYMSADFTSSQP